jgi:hypothetical protein
VTMKRLTVDGLLQTAMGLMFRGQDCPQAAGPHIAERYLELNSVRDAWTDFFTCRVAYDAVMCGNGAPVVTPSMAKLERLLTSCLKPHELPQTSFRETKSRDQPEQSLEQFHCLIPQSSRAKPSMQH